MLDFQQQPFDIPKAQSLELYRSHVHWCYGIIFKVQYTVEKLLDIFFNHMDKKNENYSRHFHCVKFDLRSLLVLHYFIIGPLPFSSLLWCSVWGWSLDIVVCSIYCHAAVIPKLAWTITRSLLRPHKPSHLICRLFMISLWCDKRSEVPQFCINTLLEYILITPGISASWMEQWPYYWVCQ